jgi:DNA-binding NarL/FixJ family response regulator
VPTGAVAAIIDGVPATRAATPLIGRTAELEALHRAFERAADGRAGVVLVGGEAGVGKSRLVTELGQRVGQLDGLLLVGSTPSRGSVAQPFAPLTGALRTLLRSLDPPAVDAALGPARGDLARLLPELGEVGSAPAAFDALSAEPGRMFELVLSVLDRLSARRPVVLAFEDLHWAEPSTLDLVDFLARNLDGLRVLLVGTYRTDELHRTHPLRPALAELRRVGSVEALTIEPLARAEIEALAEALGGAPVAADQLDRLVERSSGLPFFVEELMAWTACADEQEVPLSLHEVLQLRIDGLGAEVGEVVRALGAGTTAGPVGDDLLARVTGLAPGEVARRVREAVSHQVLVADECGIDFRHALAREVVEAELLPSERTALHAAFAAGLEADPRAEQDPITSARIARHWTEANAAGTAVAWSLRAGRAARTAYAYAEAADHLQRVLSWWDRIDDPVAVVGASRLMVTAEAATSLVLGSRLGRARALIEAELAHDAAAPDPSLSADDRSDGRAALFALLGRLMRTTGDPTASIDVLRRSLDTFSDRPSPHRTRVRVELAHSLALTGRRAEALVEAERALAEAREVGEPATLGRATHVVGHELAMSGRIAEGVALLEEAIATATATDDVDWVSRGYINLSDVHRLVGRYEEAIATALAGYEVALQRGIRRFAFARMNAVESMIPIGRLAEAQQILDDTPGHEGHLAGLHTATTAAWLALRQGKVAGVAEVLDELGPVVAREDNLQFEGSMARNRLELAWLVGDRSDPWPVAAAVLARPADTDAGQARPEVLALLARVEADRALDPALAEADRAAARAGLARVAHLAADLSGQYLSTLAPDLAEALVRAEVARAGDRPSVAAQRWAEAAAAAEAMPDPWHRAYAAWRRAEALVADDRRDEARADAATALAAAEALGAEALAERIVALAAWGRLGPLASTDEERSTHPEAPEGAPAEGPAGDEGPAVAVDPEVARLGRYQEALGLTRREAEVLALVADGRTNGEIGQALFISTKTASVHVSNILAKLGVASRTQAAAVALRTAPG